MARLSLGPGGLSLLDQSVVSGTSFASTLILARFAGPVELGIFSLGFSVVLLALATQETLITLPYTVYAPRAEPADRPRLAGSVLIHQAALAASLALLLLAGAGLAWSGLLGPNVTSLALPLAVVIPCLLLRDFARRIGFAHLEMRASVWLDLAVATLQLGGLALLAVTATLSAQAALLVAGLASVLPTVHWFARHRTRFAPSAAAALPSLQRHWVFGRWVFGGRMLGNINSDVVMIWLVVALLGPETTGVFAACMAVVSLSNPFILGLGHFITPWIVQAFAGGPPSARRAIVGRVTLLTGAAMIAFCGGLFVFGDSLLGFLYGSRYTGHTMAMMTLALGVTATTLGMGASNALWACDRPDLNFRGSVFGMGVMLVAMPILAPNLGLLGVALALLLGRGVDAGVRIGLFLRLTTEEPICGQVSSSAPERPPRAA